MFDTHTHYFLKEFDSDRYVILDKLRENGFSGVIEAAIGMESNFLMRKYLSDSDIVHYEGLEDFIRDLGTLPLDRIVLETDSPYLTPTGCRGKKNTSLNLTAVVSRLAGAMDIPEETIENITEQNAKTAFNL